MDSGVILIKICFSKKDRPYAVVCAYYTVKSCQANFKNWMGIFVITPTYVIFAAQILFSVGHTSSSKNTSSYTLCVSSIEPVTKKISTAWYIVHLHGTVECGLLYRTLNNFDILYSLQKCCKWTGSVQLKKFHICTKTIWTPLANKKCLKSAHSSCSVISRKNSHSFSKEEMHTVSSHFPTLKDMI